MCSYGETRRCPTWSGASEHLRVRGGIWSPSPAAAGAGRRSEHVRVVPGAVTRRWTREGVRGWPVSPWRYVHCACPWACSCRHRHGSGRRGRAHVWRLWGISSTLASSGGCSRVWWCHLARWPGFEGEGERGSMPWGTWPAWPWLCHVWPSS
jgi:hypothetical protein